MSLYFRHILIFLGGGFLFAIDRWLKWQTLHEWSTQNLLHPRFGWFPFSNTGIAFSIPVPDWAQIILTIPVILILSFFLVKNIASLSSKLLKTLAFSFIIFGALSNLIDRILYHFTVDYLLIFTSIINLADALVVVGFLLYFISIKTREH
jgi:signal peptidase II